MSSSSMNAAAARLGRFLLGLAGAGAAAYMGCWAAPGDDRPPLTPFEPSRRCDSDDMTASGEDDSFCLPTVHLLPCSRCEAGGMGVQGETGVDATRQGIGIRAILGSRVDGRRAGSQRVADGPVDLSAPGVRGEVTRTRRAARKEGG